MKQRVVIIGAGPAGIFAALQLAEQTDLEVILLDKGPSLEERIISRTNGAPYATVMEGFGGAGAFADGKLTLSTTVGGTLAEIVGEQSAGELIATADELWCRYGAPGQIFGEGGDRFADLKRRATLAGMQLVSVPIRHIGTDRSPLVFGAIFEAVKNRVDIRMNTPAARLETDDGRIRGVKLADGSFIEAAFVIACPGRSGARWFQQECRRLDLELLNNAVDIGVRVEMPAAVLAELTDTCYEFKLHYWSRTFDNLVRTFCVCPYGEVVTETSGDIVLVNGHSYAEKRTENTNFALLVSSRFTAPFNEPIRYGHHIAGLANMLGDGVLVQRLADLRQGRRSTAHRLSHSIVQPTLACATPGDLSFVLPYRHLTAIMEMLEAMDQLAPGAASGHTLLYGAEVKLYSSRLPVDADLQTAVKGLYACGDGAGLTRGLMQASASGYRAAQSVQRCVAATD